MKDALRQLKELQAERRERFKTDMNDAIRLHKTEEMKGLPYDLAAISAAISREGFVYATAEIQREINRRQRLHNAAIAEKAHFNLAEYDSALINDTHEPEYERKAA